MRRSLLWMLLAAMAIPLFARAADRGTPDQAKAMAIKAGEYMQQVGAVTAFAAFGSKDAAWHDRDLYVFVTDDSHKIVAHGAMPALVGRELANLRDVDGRSISDLIHAVKDAGWIEYKWQDPATKVIALKASYVVVVGPYRVVCGAYK